MAKLDQLADTFGNTNNPLGSLIGFGLRHRLGVPAGASLLRGMGRGLGSLRDRMSPQDSSFDSWSEDDSSSPRKIFSDDGDSGNSGEILIRLTSIENILRGMSQLATKSDERDAASVETDRQSQEELHRLAERPDDPSISMSPIRVGDGGEEKSGGIFSKIFGGLTRFAEFLGPGGTLLAGIIGLGVAGFGAKKLWDWASEDDGLIGNVTEGLEKSFEVIGEVIKETLGDSLWNIGFGIRDSVMESIRSLDWDEALRIFAGAGAIPVVAGKVAQGTANLTARALAAGGPATTTAAARVRRPGGRGARISGRWSPTNFSSILQPRVANPAGTAGTMVSRMGPDGLPLGVPGQGAAAANLSDDAVRGASAISRAWSTLTTSSPRAAAAARVAGTGMRFAGSAAGVVATGYDIHTLGKMEDEKAKLVKMVGIIAGGLATILGGAAILGSGGLLTPLVLGVGGGIASIYADRMEEEARGEGDTSPTRARGGDPAGDGVMDEVFQMFPTYEAGRDAQRSLWKSGGYQEEDGKPRTVRSAIQRWSGGPTGSPGAAPSSYLRALMNAAGATGRRGNSKLMKDVSDAELNAMMDAQEDHEGWKPPSAAEPEGSRSYRNNNPGNIKWTNATKSSYLASAMAGQSAPTAGPVASVTAPTPTPTLSRGRTEPNAADTVDTASAAPTAVVAPQTTNNFFDNRNTTIMPPPLDARNRDAVLMAMQNLQGLTHATG
jgi:hypothetical protein